MPTYSYECPSCHTITTGDYARGSAPKTIECSCGSTAERLLSQTAVADVSAKEKNENTELRKNLKKRREKLSQSTDPKATEAFNKWSKRQTGGKW